MSLHQRFLYIYKEREPVEGHHSGGCLQLCKMFSFFPRRLTNLWRNNLCKLFTPVSLLFYREPEGLNDSKGWLSICISHFGSLIFLVLSFSPTSVFFHSLWVLTCSDAKKKEKKKLVPFRFAVTLNFSLEGSVVCSAAHHWSVHLDVDTNYPLRTNLIVIQPSKKLLTLSICTHIHTYCINTKAVVILMLILNSKRMHKFSMHIILSSAGN